MSKSPGFYSNKDGKLLYAPTAVHFADGSRIEVSKKETYTFPVQNWSFFESEGEARTAFDLPAATEVAPATQGDVNNRAQTEAQRAERQADRIARISHKDPARAEKLRAELSAETQTRSQTPSNRANRPARFLSEASLAKAKAAPAAKAPKAQSTSQMNSDTVLMTLQTTKHGI